MASPFLALPHELTEAILGWIESPTDVLSLARACSLLRDLAIPAHLYYRHIDVASTSGELALWTHLARRPRLAQNVRVLGIGRLPRRVPPGAPVLVVESVDADAVQAAWATREIHDISDQRPEFKAQAMLTAALRNMTGLTSFYWDCEEDVWYAHDDWVWSALKAAGAPLRALIAGITTRNIVFDAQGHTLLADTTMHDLDPSHLTHLTLRFGLDTHEIANCARLRLLLTQCTSLRTFELRYAFHANGRADLSSVFAGLRLPALRRLVLDDVAAGANAVRDFVVAHTALETLHICAAPGFDVSTVPEGAFPGLTSYAPGDAQSLLHAVAVVGTPALQEVVLTARQIRQFGDEDARLPWIAALDALRHTVPMIGTWDPYARVGRDLEEAALLGNMMVGRETRDPWH